MLQSYFSSHIILPKDKSIFLPMHVLCFQKVQKKQNKTKQKKATCFDFWLDLKKLWLRQTHHEHRWTSTHQTNIGEMTFFKERKKYVCLVFYTRLSKTICEKKTFVNGIGFEDINARLNILATHSS